MAGWTYMNAGVLFKIAVTAYERTKDAPSDRAGDQNDALVAVLFAAASLEALITELAVTAESDGQLLGDPRLASLADILNEVEDARGRPQLKFQLARTLLAGQGYQKGESPYQDFAALMVLRDSLVHMKPEDEAERQRILKRLRALNICMEETPNRTSSWLAHVGTRAVARWACNVVVDMAKSLEDSLKAGPSQTVMTAASLSSRFRRVE